MKNQALKVISQVKELIQNKELIDTIFPNSSLEIIRPALIDAFMLGFSLDDFAKKDVYVLEGTLGSKYNIVVSIDYYRKTAAKNGLEEIGQPLYEYDSEKRLLGCSMRVVRHGITTTTRVIFSDYDKGTGLWVSKPFVMLAKVCEASAYRKAFPELFSKMYIEEEFEKELGGEHYKIKLEKSGSLAELKHIWTKFPLVIRKDKEIMDLKNKLKEKYGHE
jgi:hypothetical protein